MLTAQETPGVCSALSRPRPQVTPQTEEGVGLAFRFPRGAHADPGAEGPPPAGAERAPDLSPPDAFTPEPGRCSWGLASKSVARGPATNVQSAPPLCRACGSPFLVLFLSHFIVLFTVLFFKHKVASSSLKWPFKEERFPWDRVVRAEGAHHIQAHANLRFRGSRPGGSARAYLRNQGQSGKVTFPKNPAQPEN